ncbi:MAG: hypothetical protein FWG05_04450 [Kiritimatiellaeota bacterium]|nr:hypothetical protein [Kiritimatiellota bacterium]
MAVIFNFQLSTLNLKLYLFILALLFALGITAALVGSLRYDWYTVPKEKLFNLSNRLHDFPREERFEQWYVERTKLETPRKFMVDCGTGFATLSVVLALLFATTRFPLRKAGTPRRKWMFILIYIMSVVIQTPLSCFFHDTRLRRFEYPVWGDSILIPIFQTFTLSVVLGIIGLLFFLFALAFAEFPAPLWNWSSKRKIRSLIVTLIFGAPVALFLVLLRDGVRFGGWGEIILFAMLVYLFLSLRAGIIAKHGKHTTPVTLNY